MLCWRLDTGSENTVGGLWLAHGAGDQWQVNFNRKQTRLTSAAEWQTPVEHDPDTYGF